MSSDVARIGREPTLLELEAAAMDALREAQRRPSGNNMLRYADLWRLYMAAFNRAFRGGQGA